MRTKLVAVAFTQEEAEALHGFLAGHLNAATCDQEVYPGASGREVEAFVRAYDRLGFAMRVLREDEGR
jgi:hypothetical protein